MGLPINPATGTLLVGDNATRQWRSFLKGTGDQVLKINTLSGTFDLEWSNSLGVKTLQSDFTLLDTAGGAENLIIRVNLTGETSFVNSEPDQTMYFGGHTAGSALKYSMDVNEHLWTPSGTRNQAVELNASKAFIVRHGATQALFVNATAVQTFIPVQVKDPTGAGVLTITSVAGGTTFFGNNETNTFMYFGDGVASNSVAMWTDGSSVNIGQFSGAKKVNFQSRKTTPGFGWAINFSEEMSLSTTELSCQVKGIFTADDANNNTVLSGLRVDRTVTGGARGAAGMGSSLDFNLVVSAVGGPPAGQKQISSQYISKWTDPDTATLDTTVQLTARNAGVLTTMFELLGGVLAVNVPVDFTHAGTKLGFYSTAAVARPAAYTQTFSAASRTHPVLTSAALSSLTGGTADGTVQAVVGSGDDARINDNFEDTLVEYNKLRTDVDSLKRLVNSLIDDGQTLGLLQ